MTDREMSHPERLASVNRIEAWLAGDNSALLERDLPEIRRQFQAARLTTQQQHESLRELTIELRVVKEVVRDAIAGFAHAVNTYGD